MTEKCVAITNNDLKEVDISGGEHLLLFNGGGYTLNGESLPEWMAGELEEFLDFLNREGFINASDMEDPKLDKYINKFKTARYVLFFPGLSHEATKRAEAWHDQHKKPGQKTTQQGKLP